MARALHISSAIHNDPEFNRLSVEERLAFIAYVAGAADDESPFKISTEIAQQLLESMRHKGLISLPEP